MSLHNEQDLQKLVETNAFKLLETYKSILRRMTVPGAEKLGIEDAMRPFSVTLSSESILSITRTLLDIIQELRVRASVNGNKV